MTWSPDYCTSDELTAYLRIGDDRDDVQLKLAITAASRAVDSTCRRQFGSAISTRTYDAYFDGQWYLSTDDFPTSLMTVTRNAGSVAVTVLPRNAEADGVPYNRVQVPGPGTYTVTGTWGWSEIPATVKEAALLQASRFHARRDSPFGVAGSPDNGAELRLLAKVDPDVAVMLRPYVRRWWSV